MNISLYPYAAATRISRFGMAGLLIAFAGIALLGVSHPAYADGFIYEGTYNTGGLVSAYENSGTQINTVAIPIPTAEFTHPQDYIIIDAITPVGLTGFTYVNGDQDDVATNLQYLSGSTAPIYKNGSDTVTISWLPIDLSGINDGDSGLWLGTFEVDFTFYGYPTGYSYYTNGKNSKGGINPPIAYPEMYEYVTFDAQVNDTPEPNTLLLLGSGLLGMAGMLRRKLRRG